MEQPNQTENSKDFYRKKVEVIKNLTWCSNCGRLSTTIPFRKYRCPYCERWTDNYLNIRGHRFIFYLNKKKAVAPLLRK